jgi:hypothetical protein
MLTSSTRVTREDIVDMGSACCSSRSTCNPDKKTTLLQLGVSIHEKDRS